mmetsp:Transcript_14587/g.40538  ORF Transcript_14587/g.40538 Transcript_14587/m.40538 type:complete len:379 (-) Transcript_14587:56-1192(-)
MNRISGENMPEKLLPKTTSTGEVSFPWKLHFLLEESERCGFQDVISWQGDRAFKVHNQKQFEDLIMKKYFKQTQYKSFQRQLNIYGFKRVKVGSHFGSYTHPYLVRGEAAICRFMVRTKIKNRGTRSKKPASGNTVRKSFSGFKKKEKLNDINSQTCESTEKISLDKSVHGSSLALNGCFDTIFVRSKCNIIEPGHVSLDNSTQSEDFPQRRSFKQDPYKKFGNVVPCDENIKVSNLKDDSFHAVRFKLLSLMNRVVDNGNLIFGQSSQSLSPCQQEELQQQHCHLMEKLDQLFQQQQHIMQNLNEQQTKFCNNAPQRLEREQQPRTEMFEMYDCDDDCDDDCDSISIASLFGDFIDETLDFNEERFLFDQVSNQTCV